MKVIEVHQGTKEELLDLLLSKFFGSRGHIYTKGDREVNARKIVCDVLEKNYKKMLEFLEIQRNGFGCVEYLVTSKDKYNFESAKLWLHIVEKNKTKVDDQFLEGLE